MEHPNLAVPQQASSASVQPSGSGRHTVGIVLITALVTVAVAAAGYWTYRTYGPSVAPEESPSPSPSAQGEHVSWQDPEELGDLKWLPSYGEVIDPQYGAHYRKVGAFTAGPYEGSELLVVIGAQEGPGWPPAYRFVRKTDGSVVLLTRQSDVFWAPPDFIPPFTADDEYVVPDLEFPSFLPSPWDTVVLRRESTFGLFGYRFWEDIADRELVVAFESDYGTVYTEAVPTVAPTPTEDGYVPSGPFGYYGFYLRAPDGAVITYAPDVDFLGGVSPAIRWDDTGGSFSEYATWAITGCGQYGYLNVIPEFQIDPERDLIRIGMTRSGDPILALADANHPRMKSVYDGWYYAEPQFKPTYEVFRSLKPLIYWVDPMDRLVEFMAKEVFPPTECGKPVIYLYPETAGWFDVTVEPVGGMSVSEPDYGRGWRVYAEPDGSLYHSGTDTTYPYLFWEGRGGIYRTPERGWVIDQAGVSAFLDEKLSAFGLNAQETADFKEFWLPRMQDSPWYFVTFLDNRYMDALAPLTVSPAPDTVIRVLMDFTGLDEPIDAEPFVIRTPERRGFTVVEWGGVLR